MISDKVEVQQNVPKWVSIIGAVIGIITLFFFMLLVLLVIMLKADITKAKYLITIVLALGTAISTSFLSGAAAAKGSIPIWFTEKYPITFSTTGGIAVFFLVLIIGNTIYPEETKTESNSDYTIYIQYNNEQNIEKIEYLRDYLKHEGFIVPKADRTNKNKIRDIRYYFDIDKRGAESLQYRVNKYFKIHGMEYNLKINNFKNDPAAKNAKKGNIELWFYF